MVTKESRDNSRRQDIIHPSEMSHSDWCPLATYLRIVKLRSGGEHLKESFGFQSLNIFQHGHEVHHKWQNWLAEMGELWGVWECHRCEYTWTATSPGRCADCGSQHITYEEIPLPAEEELLISGSADGGVPRHQALLEFKTVGAGTLRIEAPEILKAHTHKTTGGKTLVDYEGLWRGINRPFPAHQKQGQIYLYICKLRGLDFDKVIYIYESKFHQGAKEFVVQRRESLIERLLESADQIHAAVNGMGPPPRCPKGGCKHCETHEKGNDREATAAGGIQRGGPGTTPAGRQGTGVASPAPRRRRPPAA